MKAMISTLLLATILPGNAKASFTEATLHAQIELDPEQHRLTFTIRFDATGLPPHLLVTPPADIIFVRDGASGSDISFDLVSISPELDEAGFAILALEKVPEILEMKYVHNQESFRGWSYNPATNDRLHLGQISPDSIYSTHLQWYPAPDGHYFQRAHVEFVVPLEFTVVSSGQKSVSYATADPLKTVRYDIAADSSRLPFVFAMARYHKTTAIFQQRTPVTIYHAAAHSAFAQEKLDFIQEKALPFLEDLMGPYPFTSLRVAEVFPNEGNTGIAAPGVVILSERIWFAEPMTGADSPPAMVLIDEIAHQWNYYKAPWPNFLAEGISEYTDLLFGRSELGDEWFAGKIAEYHDTYLRVADLIARLKAMRDTGKDIASAAAALALDVDRIEAFWDCGGLFGELPISDPQICPVLYFLKGALALEALRLQLGDVIFKNAFRQLFQDAAVTYSISGMQEVFERHAEVDLNDFFQSWYHQAGIPEF